MLIRDYDEKRDLKPACRIWREVGWLDNDDPDDLLADYVRCGQAVVAELDGAAESIVLTVPGDMRCLSDTLAASCVTGVTTSRIARRQGLATRLTAHAVARDAAQGAKVAALGVFDQGFYDRLGFGTGVYEHRVSLDPAQLRAPRLARAPRRVTRDDWEQAHQARLARWRCHGSINVEPAGITRAEMRDDDVFGLGFFDGPNGELTHYLWCHTKDAESDPCEVRWMAYRSREQFLELMAVLASLAEQFPIVTMQEPPGIQMQSLVRQPFRVGNLTRGAKHPTGAQAYAYWQTRICDLPACVACSRLPGADLRFNLQLADPVEPLLDETAPWRGVAGTYVVTLCPSSGAEPGEAPGLPTLTCSVGTFTRLWLGVASASSLAITGDLCAPPSLLEALDDAVRLPVPHQDWDF